MRIDDIYSSSLLTKILRLVSEIEFPVRRSISRRNSERFSAQLLTPADISSAIERFVNRSELAINLETSSLLGCSL